MDAPERIGLIGNGLGQWGLATQDEAMLAVHYVRATEHDRIVAEKDAEIASWRQIAEMNGFTAQTHLAEIVRLTAERDAIAALTVERCAEVAKVGWVSADYDLVGIADADMAMKLCEHIAAAIRAMKGVEE